jgi:pilus assembly protein CpaD
MTEQTSTSSSSHKIRLALALIGFAALGGCTHQSQDAAIVTGGLPDDYRLRHPIVIQEASKTTEIFVGHARGGLTGAQRADVAGLAQEWLRQGTGAIIIDLPSGTPNAQAAKQTVAEIQGILTGSGIPPRGINVRPYTPTDPRQFATIRLRYPRIMADAGPCGTWPEDLGPSIKDRSYYENREYHNFGCATQRNLAAMIDNPADLVQPRAETPSNSARRTAAFAKYRAGQATSVSYPDTDKAKLSDLGK